MLSNLRNFLFSFLSKSSSVEETSTNELDFETRLDDGTIMSPEEIEEEMANDPLFTESLRHMTVETNEKGELLPPTLKPRRKRSKS